MNGFKQLLQYISSDRFTATYGEVFIVPKRINQDSIESFFFYPETDVWRKS